MLSLPPGLSHISSHIFGSLYVQVTNFVDRNQNKQNLSQNNYTHFTPVFFGDCRADQNTDLSNSNGLQNRQASYQIGQVIQYKIVTNMWLFYLYLSDMENLNIQLTNPNNIYKQSSSKIPLQLRPSNQILNPQLKNMNIFVQSYPLTIETFASKQNKRYTVIDMNGAVIGSIGARLWAQFDQQIHEDIKEMVDFSSMVVFQGISPINSQAQLPRQPPQQLSTVLSKSINSRKSQKQIKSNIEEVKFQKTIKNAYEMYKQQEYHEEKEYKIMEQDIDKLIQQMQSRPYDSSRYQESEPINKQINYSNTSNSHQNIFRNRSKPNSSQKDSQRNRSNSHSLHEESLHSNNFNKYPQTQASSTLTKNNYSRPPSYSPVPKQRPPQPPQTVLTKSPHLIKNAEHFYNNTTSLSKTQSQNFAQNSYLELKVHQMLFTISNAMSHNLFTQLMQPCYTLKIYLNSDRQQYYAGQGIKDGQIVIFNQNLKIRNVNTLQSLRFVVCDDYGQVQAEGIFDLGRLYASKDAKGVFTVPLLGLSSNMQQKIKATQNKLQQVSPLHRTLRIEAQMVERVEMVQIFMKISKANLPFNMIRYKIPLTKQTIQHPGNNHVNIFPHNCSQHTSDKLILEFWRNQQNIGQSQLSLKNIKNYNASALNSNVDPVYLYDGKKQIRNILEGDRVVGDFNLILCFGTVKQMQSMLLSTIDSEKQTKKENSKKVQATYDERLGVYVNKKAVSSNQISVQVEIQPDFVQNQRESNQYLKYNQPSFGDQSIISLTSHNQFIDLQPSLISFANNQIPKKQIRKPDAGIQQPPMQTLTKKLQQNIINILQPILSLIPTLKQKCKPHLMYNFINNRTLQQIFSRLGIKSQQMDIIFKTVLFVKQDMVNINILYDLCASIQIDGGIKQCLISDQMFIVNAMRQLYRDEKLRKSILIQSEMEFKEMSEEFKKINLKLTLHQFQILEKFINKYKTKKQAEELKKAIISQLQNETMLQIKQCFYEQDILKQIYGDQSSYNYSISDKNQSLTIVPQQKQTFSAKPQPKIIKEVKSKEIIVSQTKNISKQNIIQKQNIVNRITLSGIDNALQSAECVFDQVPTEVEFKITITSPTPQQLLISVAAPSLEFKSKMEIKDADGRIQMLSKGKVLALAAFSLIKEVKSLYALKTKDGQFCGLIHILLQ